MVGAWVLQELGGVMEGGMEMEQGAGGTEVGFK